MEYPHMTWADPYDLPMVCPYDMGKRVGEGLHARNGQRDEE